MKLLLLAMNIGTISLVVFKLTYNGILTIANHASISEYSYIFCFVICAMCSYLMHFLCHSNVVLETWWGIMILLMIVFAPYWSLMAYCKAEPYRAVPPLRGANDYKKALQSYQEYLSEIKSPQRDKAAAARENYRYY